VESTALDRFEIGSIEASEREADDHDAARLEIAPSTIRLAIDPVLVP
jgi:hypothetical protein